MNAHGYHLVKSLGLPYVAVLAILLLSILNLTACRSVSVKPSSEYPVGGLKDLINISQESAEAAEKQKKRSRKMETAQRGIDSSSKCISKFPEAAPCYYWHAVNTGLYYEARVLGYQKGVKEMIEDCNMVIKLDSSYQHGGAYRILGELFTKLPQSAGRPDSFTRDLEKAEGYLKKAIEIAPDFPENYLVMTENLLSQGKIKEAIDTLAKARKLGVNWRQDKSYQGWKIIEKRLEKSIATRNKE